MPGCRPYDLSVIPNQRELPYTVPELQRKHARSKPWVIRRYLGEEGVEVSIGKHGRRSLRIPVHVYERVKAQIEEQRKQLATLPIRKPVMPDHSPAQSGHDQEVLQALKAQGLEAAIAVRRAARASQAITN